VLDALRSNLSTSIIKKLNINIDDIDNNTQNSPYEITKSLPRVSLNESFTNMLENLSVDKENASSEESKMMKLILEMTKQVLPQNSSIIEKQESLDAMKGIIQGIKSAIDNWLYPNDKIYTQAIQKELEALFPDKMGRYKKDSKWVGLFAKIENSISAESCKYRESEIIAWKESEKVQWCLENLDSMIKEEDKMYLQIVAKKVFGRQPTRNQYAVTWAILHNLFDPGLVKIKFDEKYLTRKLNAFLQNNDEDNEESQENNES
ncbi:8882_t:CDS:2, partial [Racocetra persica]